MPVTRSIRQTERYAGRLAACSLLALAALVIPSPASARTLTIRTIVTFNRAANETPENMVMEPDGTIYLSLAFAGEIRRLSTNGKQASVFVPTAGGFTVDLAADSSHGGDLDVAVKSPDSSDSGIWRVPLTAFDDPSVKPSRIAALPTSSVPNGLEFDTSGQPFIADSNLGTIWRLSPGSSVPSVWSQGPLLQPTGASFDGFPLPGANDLNIAGRVMYVSNTATNEILSIPVEPDGSAGGLRVRFRIDAPDDFAIAPGGDFYVAQNVPSLLSRIRPDGTVTTLASASDGLANPSSAYFGRAPGQRSLLYITNAAYFGGTPSLQVTRIHGVGRAHP